MSPMYIACMTRFFIWQKNINFKVIDLFGKTSTVDVEANRMKKGYTKNLLMIPNGYETFTNTKLQFT